MLAGFSFGSTAPLKATQLANGSNRLFYIFLALKPPDLPIEKPDLHITAVHKLASGLKGLRVCFGVDRFVRSYAIIPIN
jgi:hypothetical protein